MGVKEDLQAKLDSIQAKLNVVNRVPEDRFSIGTIALFSAATGLKWYYVKIGEESWTSLKGNLPGEGLPSGSKSLAAWILYAVESNIGYFEVYEMKVHPTPFFASS